MLSTLQTAFETAAVALRIDWRDVVRFITGADASPILPASSVCPHCCEATLTIDHDNVFDAEWYCCSNCKLAGFGPDMLEAFVRDRFEDIYPFFCPAAASEASAAVQPHHVEAYRTFAAVRKALDRFVAEACSGKLETDPSAAREICKMFGMPCHLTSWTRFKDVSGSFGVGTAKALEAAWTGDGAIADARSPLLEFRGAKTMWQTFAFIPFHDAPGRCCGGVCAAVHDGHLVCKPLGFYRRKTGGKVDLGLGMTSLLDGARHDDFAIVVDDVELVAKLQMRRLAAGERPFPLVAAVESAPFGCESMTAVLGRRLVHAAVDNGGELAAVRRAFRSGGAVAPARIDWEAVRAAAGTGVASAMLRKAASQAEPWEVALARRLGDRPFGEVQNLLRVVGIGAGAVAKMIGHCDPTTARQIESAYAQEAASQVIVVGRGRYVRRGGQWFRVSSEHASRVCNATASLRRRIAFDDRDGEWLEIAFEFEGKEVVELVPRRNIRQSFLRRMQDAADQVDFDLEAASIFRKVGWTLVKHSASGERQRMSHRVGWNRRGAAFCFPHFAIERVGFNHSRKSWVDRDTDTPCLHFVPGDMTETSVEALSSEDAAVAWPVICYTLNYAVCSALGAKPYGLAVRGFERLPERLAKACGMATGPRKRFDRRHRWPHLQHPDRMRSNSSLEEMLREGSRNYAVGSDASLDSLALYPNWRVYSIDEKFDLSTEILQAIPEAIVDYLAYFCARYCRVPDFARQGDKAVLDDVRRWFALRKGDPSRISRVRQASISKALAAALIETVSITEWKRFERVEGSIAIPQTRLCLAGGGAIRPPLEYIVARFEAEGVKAGVVLRGGARKLTVPEDWLQANAMPAPRKARKEKVELGEVEAVHRG